MQFKIEKKLGKSLGRAGIVKTAHGEVHTPAFVPVATKASTKALTPEMVRDLGAEIVLGNTYHLYLQPGDEVVRDAGGIGKFMNWPGPTMTDSGGFQVFSLGAAYEKGVSKIISSAVPKFFPPAPFPHTNKEEGGTLGDKKFMAAPQDENFLGSLVKINEDGVSFKSHLDGSLHYITPEKSIQIQHNLGADIIFAFDECTSPIGEMSYQGEALERTHRWAERSLEEHNKLNKEKIISLFGIVQGGRDENLRKKSAKTISNMDFDGFGIGGSFAKEDMSSAVKWVNEILPEEKPRHLLGIGEPEDLFMGVENGVDLFDCVAPTRNGRNGTLYTKHGKINIMNAKFVRDFSSVDSDCGCYTCLPRPEAGGVNFTRAYLNHLFRSKEMLAGTLATVHNLYFIVNLVKKIRQSILEENFFEYKNEFLSLYNK